MQNDTPGILHFRETYLERIWGGQRLHTLYGKPLPPGASIGEAWMVSDHATCESVVDEGPWAGLSLRRLVQERAKALLGTHAAPTPQGRFPLLLKLLDARDVLSVQVHPDDATARALGEPDVGKTEMWHVLHADAGSELCCGLSPDARAEDFAAAIADGSIEQALVRFPVTPGTSVFVPAGIVHAIGAGIVVAEIQQNSDLTYRLYDWGRVDDAGKARDLHIEKAMRAIHFGSPHAGAAPSLFVETADARHAFHAACRYFAAIETEFQDRVERATGGRSFHLLLGKKGRMSVQAGFATRLLAPGEALLVPGSASSFAVEGTGAFLDYFVPDLQEDIAVPLCRAGHADAAIFQLGDAPSDAATQGDGASFSG